MKIAISIVGLTKPGFKALTNFCDFCGIPAHVYMDESTLNVTIVGEFSITVTALGLHIEYGDCASVNIKTVDYKGVQI